MDSRSKSREGAEMVYWRIISDRYQYSRKSWKAARTVALRLINSGHGKGLVIAKVFSTQQATLMTYAEFLEAVDAEK